MIRFFSNGLPFLTPLVLALPLPLLAAGQLLRALRTFPSFWPNAAHHYHMQSLTIPASLNSKASPLRPPLQAMIGIERESMGSIEAI